MGPAREYRIVTSWESWLFWMTLLAAVSTIWIAKRPPMVDLPQHIAQVVEWRALLEGRFGWADLVQLNYLTPYILSYALLLPLTYVMDITVAAKLLLSISFFAFVVLCVLLRAELGGDKRLDWLFLFGFFGFAWRFGFLQYLNAAPLVILFLIVALRQTRDNSPKNQLLVLLIGVLLLLSHGLQFLFAIVIGGLFILLDRRTLSYKLRAYTPYCLLGALTFTLWWTMNHGNDFGVTQNTVFDHPFYNRLKIPFYILGNDRQDWWGLGATIVAFAIPLLVGCRVGSLQACIPLGVCVFVLLFVPHIWAAAAFIYHRFALFLLPFWALAFRPGEAGSVSASSDRARFAALSLAALTATEIQAHRQFVFGRDSMGFETVLAAAKPNQRSLSLVYEPSEPNSMYPIYRNFPVWYAVEKGGFVDFNFGFYVQSIVRYRSDRMPATSKFQGFFSPQSDINSDLPLYHYFFIRGTSEEVGQLMKSTKQCRLILRAKDGLWQLFEQEGCAR